MSLCILQVISCFLQISKHAILFFLTFPFFLESGTYAPFCNYGWKFQETATLGEPTFNHLLSIINLYCYFQVRLCYVFISWSLLIIKYWLIMGISNINSWQSWLYYNDLKAMKYLFLIFHNIPILDIWRVCFRLLKEVVSKSYFSHILWSFSQLCCHAF